MWNTQVQFLQVVVVYIFSCLPTCVPNRLVSTNCQCLYDNYANYVSQIYVLMSMENQAWLCHVIYMLMNSVV